MGQPSSAGSEPCLSASGSTVEWTHHTLWCQRGAGRLVDLWAVWVLETRLQALPRPSSSWAQRPTERWSPRWWLPWMECTPQERGAWGLDMSVTLCVRVCGQVGVNVHKCEQLEGVTCSHREPGDHGWGWRGGGTTVGKDTVLVTSQTWSWGWI